MTQIELPVLDLHAFETGDTSRRNAIGRMLDEACRDVGFFMVVGHEVPHQVFEDVERAARRFFALPSEEKMKVATGGRQNRGYVPLNSESSISTRLAKDAPAPADLKEAFAVGRLDARPNDETVAHADVQYEPNVWPNNPPEFKAAFEHYYTELERLVIRTLPVFANALGVKDDFFSQFFSVHNCIMRSHIYPTQKARPEPGQIRNGAHSDFGAFTFLSVPNKSGARGLQLLNGSDEWIDIAPRDNAFIVNIGDLMMAWTNDRWRSTLHRVINPKHDSDENVDRFSISYFAHTNFDSLIECIPTCVAAGATPHHQPFLAGEHRQAKLRKLAMAK